MSVMPQISEKWLPESRELLYYWESNVALEAEHLPCPAHRGRLERWCSGTWFICWFWRGCPPQFLVQKRKRMKIWSSSWKWLWTIIEPISKARIVPIVCYLSADKGCPPDCEESGESPECLMWVTLKPWKDTWDTLNVPLLHAPILLEFGEISLTFNCRFFFP